MSVTRRQTKFEVEVTRHTVGLRAFLRKRLGNEADADDALQEILYNLFRTAGPELDSIANLPAWLYRAARNLLANLGRRAPEWSLDEDFILDILADDRYGQESAMLRQLFWRELDGALEQLPPEQREVWELSELDGLTTKEIAEITHASQATVLSRKHYAVKQLRRRLRRLYDDILTTS